MDFSVVIPVLNEAEYLEECLTSLRAQRIARERFEIIVVDNGSTDSTLEILERQADVTTLSEPRRDPYLARNRGIRAAAGRVIAFTDADCRVAPDWLERIDRWFADRGADLVVGRLVYPKESSFFLDRYADYYDAKTKWLFERPVNDCLFGHGGNMTVRADLFARIGLFKPMPCAGDTEIIHRALAEIDDIVIRYDENVAVTHLEVARLADLLPKLHRYGGYTEILSGTTKFRALSLSERLRVTARCVAGNRYGPFRLLGLLAVLGIGFVAFERGRLVSLFGSES